jgi:hypothetical protein
MRRNSSPAVVLAFLVGLPGATRALATPTVVEIASRELARLAAAQPAGQRLHVRDLELSATGEMVDVDVQRFEVFAPDAQVIVHGANGVASERPPANRYFRGSISGKPTSTVFLDVMPGGRTKGVIDRRGDGIYLIDSLAKSGPGGSLSAVRVDAALLAASRPPWSCDQGRLPRVSTDGVDLVPGPVTAPGSPPDTKATFTHTVTVAIETDYEYLHLSAFGGNTTLATNYVGDLLGYIATIYQAEIQTDLQVGSVELWNVANAGLDPWTQTDTFCGLMEFGKYWNTNKTGVSRTIAHFLSGKALGGGIAWIGAFCLAPFNTGANATCPTAQSAGCPACSCICPALGSEGSPNWGGDYGFSAQLSGTFDVNNPQVIWDVDEVAHEIGHNFSSPHSHCYKNIGGNPSEIDDCDGGELPTTSCYSGSPSLPGIESLVGSGKGTIMSYCHLLTGDVATGIDLTFGIGYDTGIAPWREAQKMQGYVQSVWNSSPTCVANPASWLLVDGFESGTVPGAWKFKSP